MIILEVTLQALLRLIDISELIALGTLYKRDVLRLDPMC